MPAVFRSFGRWLIRPVTRAVRRTFNIDRLEALEARNRAMEAAMEAAARNARALERDLADAKAGLEAAAAEAARGAHATTRLAAATAEAAHLAGDNARLEQERAFHANKVNELDARIQLLTASSTATTQKLYDVERDLLAARIEIGTIAPEHARLKAERTFFAERVAALQAHNRALTEAATKYARQLQGHVEFEAGTSTLPSILITSIPKSGTVFTGQKLSQGLGAELVGLAVGSFPRYLFDLPRLARFARGGKVATEHCDASPENLQMLDAFLDRWVVHIRDPRSVVLSWVHNLDRLHRERDAAPHHLLYVCPTPPARYFDASFADRVDWNIEHFLPSVVAWTDAWIKECDSGRRKILLTTFSEIVAGEDKYLHRILDFYGIAHDRLKPSAIEKSVRGSHFRVGREDEWRDCFTPDQLARCRARIGDELMERFGWPR